MEQRNPVTKKRLIIFTILSLLLGWTAFLSIPLKGHTYGDQTSIIFLTVAMFTPALSSVLTRLLTKEGFGDMYLRPNFRGHFKEYLLVYFGPTILLFLSGILYFLIFPKMFDPQFAELNNLIVESGPAETSIVTMVLIPVLLVVLIGPIINIIPTLGEELGWRGYLMPKLRETCSDRTAVVITGAVWGFWHLPAIVMGHNYGTDYVGYPWLGVLAMIAFCMVLGIIEGYATIKTNSVIPAAMIHSTLNAGAALPIMVAKSGYNTLIGPAVTGLVGGIPFIVVAILLFLKLNQKNDMTA